LSGGSLRVLAFGNLPPFRLGGAENQLARLVAGWVRLGATIEVAGADLPNQPWAIDDGGVVRLHRIGVVTALGRAGRALTMLLSVGWLLLRRGRAVDVIYSRGLSDIAVAIAIWRRLGLTRAPLVAVPINARGAGDVAFLKTIPGWRWLVGLLNSQTAAINLINPLIAEELDDIGLSRPRRSHIPNGISILPLARHNATERPFRRLIWSGRFERQKGIDLLLDALAQIGPAAAALELVLVGAGREEIRLRERASAPDLSARIVFLGTRTAAEIRALLLDADAFVLPSRYEGMSNAALEAMEAGLPVLATRCGGVDRALESAQAGWLAEPDDLISLIRSLKEMLAEPLARWQQRGERARALIEANFEIQRIAAANLALLESVVRQDQA
jgi:glycosyltransferase involved in cell wall biosynthesis